MDKIEKFETLIVLIFLLPGFVGVLISTAISERSKQENLDKIILALSITLLANVIYGLITGTASYIGPLLSSEQRDKALQAFGENLGWTTVIAIFLGVAWAAVHNKALLFKAAIKLRLTRRTGAIDVWHQTFARTGSSWVRVRFKDGAMLDGWPRFYSEDSDPMQLFLADAKWYLPKEAKRDAGAPVQASSATPLSALFTRLRRGEETVSTQPEAEYEIVSVDGPGVLLTDFSDVRAIERLT